MASMIEILRSKHSDVSTTSTLSTDKVAKIHMFARCGGTTCSETAHVRNLVSRMTQSRTSSSHIHAAHIPATPPAPFQDKSYATSQDVRHDPNEPWKTSALRTAMSKSITIMPCSAWSAMKHLATCANLECGWIGKKEFMTALNEEPLKSETLTWYNGLLSSTPPSAGTSTQTTGAYVHTSSVIRETRSSRPTTEAWTSTSESHRSTLTSCPAGSRREDNYNRVIADFDGDEYGAEYMSVTKGDITVLLQHADSGEG